MSSSEELIRFHHLLCQLCRYLMDDMKEPVQYEGVALYHGECQPLLEIARREGISQSELSRWLRRTKGATSALVDKLERRGLVIRVRSNTRCLLYLTELGKQVCAEKLAQDLSQASHVMEQVPIEAEDLKTANHVMEQLLRFGTRRDCIWKETREKSEPEKGKAGSGGL